MLNIIPESLIPLILKLFFTLAGSLGLGFLIAFHELGHFLFAKLFNVRTPSFSIGFGPKIFSKKIGGTEFSLSAIPFGGYVEMAGAAEVGQGEQKEAHATDKGSFAIKPFYQKLCILFGGILFNLLFAYCTMITLFMTGIPKNHFMNSVPVIAKLHANSVAERHNVLVGDRILAIQGQSVENKTSRVQELLLPLNNTEVIFTIERNGKQQTKKIPLNSDGQCSNSLEKLGVIAFDTEPTPPHSFTNAIKAGVIATNKWIKATIAGFLHLFSKKGVQQITGPIGIVAITAQAASNGISILLLLLVLISINLAILNLIPLPILDGGQIFFYSIEALIGRSMPDRLREYIHIGTWILFLMLFIYLSGKDLYCILKPYIDGAYKLLSSK